MNRWISRLLIVSMILFSFSGCAALQALEKIKNKDGTDGKTETSSVEDDAELSADKEQPSENKESSLKPPLKSKKPSLKPSSENQEAPSETDSENKETPSEPNTENEEASSQKIPEKEPEPELQDNSLAMLQDEISQNGCMVGVSFIGYMSNSSEVELRDYIANSDNGRTYPFLNTAMLLMTEGDELYAIVPPNEQGTVTVYPSTMSETGEYVDDKSNPLFEGLPGEPVIVQCNLGDFYSNVLVTVTDSGGAIDLRPVLSGEDGRLFKESWLYDFSVYEKPLDEGEVEDATQLLSQVEEIKLAMQQGKNLMYTGDMQLINGQTCLLFTLGTGHGEQFVRETYYAVGDNSLYAFDSIYGTWNVLGMG